MTTTIRFACAACIACFAAVVHARTTDDDKYIGIGARLRPAYAGADSNRVDAIPYIRLYGEHLFARTTQGMLEGGWRTRPFGALVLGAQLAYEEGRESGESAFLDSHRVPDLDPSVSAGLHAEADWKVGRMPLNMLARYRHDLDSDNGARADLRLTAGILEWGRLRAGLVGQITWADADSMQRHFGIETGQSVAVGLPAHTAGSGLRSTQVGLIGDIDVARHWVGLWGVHFDRLQGDAADSPLTRDSGNWFANAGIAYRF